MRRAIVVQKGNGFVVSGAGEEEGGWVVDKERVVEGRDPAKIGAAVLSALEKPRGPRKAANLCQ